MCSLCCLSLFPLLSFLALPRRSIPWLIDEMHLAWERVLNLLCHHQEGEAFWVGNAGLDASPSGSLYWSLPAFFWSYLKGKELRNINLFVLYSSTNGNAIQEKEKNKNFILAWYIIENSKLISLLNPRFQILPGNSRSPVFRIMVRLCSLESAAFLVFSNTNNVIVD